MFNFIKLNHVESINELNVFTISFVQMNKTFIKRINKKYKKNIISLKIFNILKIFGNKTHLIFLLNDYEFISHIKINVIF